MQRFQCMQGFGSCSFQTVIAQQNQAGKAFDMMLPCKSVPIVSVIAAELVQGNAGFYGKLLCHRLHLLTGWAVVRMKKEKLHKIAPFCFWV
jgi:hypothetical protein